MESAFDKYVQCNIPRVLGDTPCTLLSYSYHMTLLYVLRKQHTCLLTNQSAFIMSLAVLYKLQVSRTNFHYNTININFFLKYFLVITSNCYSSKNPIPVLFLQDTY